MGLGLLVPIIARHYSGEVVIALPADIPSAGADAWRLYHKSPSRIQIHSTTATPGIACSSADATSPDTPIGLLYGGGKDSVAALALTEKLYSSSPRHLLRLHWNAKSPERHRQAFEQGVLPSMSKFTDFDYLWVSSTMHAELLDKTDAASIHLARYLCSFIHHVENRNRRYLCHGHDALDFHGSAYRRAHPQGGPSCRPYLQRAWREHQNSLLWLDAAAYEGALLSRANSRNSHVATGLSSCRHHLLKAT